MAIILPTSFSVQTQAHIDTRLVVPLLADRDNIAEAIRYWGMIVHVIDATGGNVAETYILTKFAVDDVISNNNNWVALSVTVLPGNNTEILFNDSGVLGADVGFTYDKTKDMLIAGAGSLVPDFGTGAHAQAGSWSIIAGEQHDFKGTGAGGGRPVNMIINGWHHSIGDTTIGGTFSGAGAFATGTDHELYGVNSSAFGFGAAAHGNGSFVVSALNRDAGGLVAGGDQRVLAAGTGSINMSFNSNTGQTVGHGALANQSVIIGGQNHNIPADSHRSAILGGDALKMPATTPDTVLVPNLMTDGAVTDTSGNTLFNKNFPYAEIWISPGGNDSNSGSRDEPLLTWAAAWTKRKLAPATRYSIIFDSGIWMDPTVMVFDDIGADTSETYIHGIQDGNIPRWSSGAAKIQMTNAGNIYFTGFGYYEDIEINQTGTRVCSAHFMNVTVYGTVSTTGIAVPDNAQLMVSGSNGRITVNNLIGNDVIVPLRVQGSAYLNIDLGDIDLASVQVYYSGQLYVANNHDVTIGNLDVFGDGQINVLGGSVIVNDTISWSGGAVNTWTTGTYDHSGATTTNRDERVLSEYNSYDPGATGMSATNVQEAITEVHGLIGGGGDVTAGTQADTQLAIWNATAKQIEGNTNLTWSGTALELGTGAGASMAHTPSGSLMAYGFRGDENSGMRRNGAGDFSLFSGGGEAFNIGASQTVTIKGAGFIIPSGLDAARLALQGSIRYNTTGSNFEGYNGATWDDFSSGGGVAGSGTLNQVAYWTAGDTLSSNAHLVYSGTPVMTLGTSTVDEDTKLSLTQTATSSTGDAQLFISTTATGGDPFIHLYMASTRGYIIGSDNNGGRNLEFLTTTSAVASPSSNSTLLGHFTDSGNLVVQGTISKAGGTSSQHLMADGSTTTGTFYAEPGIFSGGGTPTLASGVTGAEVRTLIGAGTGTVTSSGSPLNNEIAVFATGTDINSDSTLTWDGTKMGVGIGTAATTLHVKGSSGADLFFIDATTATDDPGMGWGQAGASKSNIQHMDSGDVFTMRSRYGDIAFDTGTAGTATERMRIHDSGDVYIGNTGVQGSSSFWFDYDTGDFHADGNIIGNSTSLTPSDRRLKKNIQYIEPKIALDIVDQLKPATYNKIGTEGNFSGHIAQELEEVLPDLIHESELLGQAEGEMFKTINTEGIIPYLVGAIQELRKEIEILKNK